MQKGIHPENYRLVAFKDMSNEEVFLTKSTADTKETLEVDGVEYKNKYKKFAKAAPEATEEVKEEEK